MERSKKTLEAAEAMKLSAKNLLELKVIDEIIEEPIGGAHRDRDLILKNVKISLLKNLTEFRNMNKEEILNNRKQKFLSIGRDKGFISHSDMGDLRMKQNTLDLFRIKIEKFKKHLLIGIGSIIILSFIIYWL